MKNDLRIAFIGGGNMASALIGGLAGKLTAAANIHVVDPVQAARDKLASQFGVTVAASIDDKLESADVLVLAVKPQQMKEVVAQLKPFIGPQLLLSIAAGIRASDLSRWLGDHKAIVRAMPNTPALIGMGITGLAALPGVSNEQREVANAILQAVGQTAWLDDEALLDPVTAVSGSGPAYVFYFMEAMQEAGQAMGLSPHASLQLTLATFAGAAQLAAQSSEPLSTLRERVTSKGGTTYAALTSMEQSGVKEAIIRALHAASDRGREMGEEFGRD